MLNHNIDGDNEASLQDSLLTAHNPPVKAKTNLISTESHSSLERKIHVSKDYWGWELFGVLGSAAILISIAVILDSLNGKRQPSWEHVSLNSLISWLSTAAKFCVLVPLTRGLGQLKWVWFSEKERPLSDLEEFDSASRGIFGSAKLLWRLRGLNFAVIGSLAIILASGLDPFIQNLIHYYPNAVSDPSQLAYLANASTYTAVGPLIGGDLDDVNQGLKANVYNAILNPESSQVWAQPQYVCNTGNCTWEPVASIGICPFCSDISTDLSMSCKSSEIPETDQNYQNCTVSLPHGFAAWFVDGGLNGSPMIIGNSVQNNNVNALVYKNHTLPVIQGILALLNDTNQGLIMGLTKETHFIATECALAPCVRSVQASVRRSIYNESTPIYWFELANTTADSNSVWNVTINPPWGPDLGVQEGQSFGISFEALDALSAYISTIFSGNVRILSDDQDFDAWSADILQAIYYGDFANCDNPLDKVGCAVNNVAKAMSKSFWDTPYINYGIDGAHMAIGETFVSLTFVQIRWWWLAFPVAIWVLSVVTLLGTVWKTRRAQVQTWRNSQLPLVFLHLHEDHEAAGSYDVSNAGFSTKAKKLRVKLYAPEDDVRPL
ncbi:hypothetical protein ACHAQJ_001040 [Trichoderma viride]